MLGGERLSCAYASLDDKRHFLFGGLDANGPSTTVVEYNSTLHNWRTHPPVPGRRIASAAAATAIDDDRFLVAGGFTLSALSWCYVYDTRSEEWSTWPDLKIGRNSHVSVYTHNKKAYVIGGYNSNGDPLDSIEEIDLSLPTPSWRVLPQRLNKKRDGCCAIAHPKNPKIIILVGGYNKNDKCLRCCETICLDQLNEGQTRPLPPMTTPRAWHTLVLVENRFIVAMGGYDVSQRVSSVEYLDLEEEAKEQQWRLLPSMKTARRDFAAFYSSESHKIVVAGGWDGGKGLDTVEELPVLFRGHARSSRQLRELPRPRIRQGFDEMTGSLAAGIPPDVNLGPALGFHGQGSFDGTARSIPSRLDGTSVNTRGPLGQGSVVGAAGFATLREDADVSANTSVAMPRVKKKKKKRRWFPCRR